MNVSSRGMITPGTYFITASENNDRVTNHRWTHWRLIVFNFIWGLFALTPQLRISTPPLKPARKKAFIFRRMGFGGILLRPSWHFIIRKKQCFRGARHRAFNTHRLWHMEHFGILQQICPATDASVLSKTPSNQNMYYTSVTTNSWCLLCDKLKR